MADMPAIGVPEGTPERPAVQAEYPAVHDMPPRRAEVPLEEAEQKKLEKELIAAREGQSSRAEEIAKPERAPKRQGPRPKQKSAGAAGTETAGTRRDP